MRSPLCRGRLLVVVVRLGAGVVRRVVVVVVLRVGVGCSLVCRGRSLMVVVGFRLCRRRLQMGVVRSLLCRGCRLVVVVRRVVVVVGLRVGVVCSLSCRGRSPMGVVGFRLCSLLLRMVVLGHRLRRGRLLVDVVHLGAGVVRRLEGVVVLRVGAGCSLSCRARSLTGVVRHRFCRRCLLVGVARLLGDVVCSLLLRMVVVGHRLCRGRLLVGGRVVVVAVLRVGVVCSLSCRGRSPMGVARSPLCRRCSLVDVVHLPVDVAGNLLYWDHLLAVVVCRLSCMRRRLVGVARLPVVGVRPLVAGVRRPDHPSRRRRPRAGRRTPVPATCGRCGRTTAWPLTNESTSSSTTKSLCTVCGEPASRR